MSNEIEEIKETIDRIKTELAISESNKNRLFEKLKDYKIDSVNMANKRVQKIKSLLEKLEVKKETLKEKIQTKLEEYEFEED